MPVFISRSSPLFLERECVVTLFLEREYLYQLVLEWYLAETHRNVSWWFSKSFSVIQTPLAPLLRKILMIYHLILEREYAYLLVLRDRAFPNSPVLERFERGDVSRNLRHLWQLCLESFQLLFARAIPLNPRLMCLRTTTKPLHSIRPYTRHIGLLWYPIFWVPCDQILE